MLRLFVNQVYIIGRLQERKHNLTPFDYVNLFYERPQGINNLYFWII